MGDVKKGIITGPQYTIFSWSNRQSSGHGQSRRSNRGLPVATFFFLVAAGGHCLKTVRYTEIQKKDPQRSKIERSDGIHQPCFKMFPVAVKCPLCPSIIDDEESSYEKRDEPESVNQLLLYRSVLPPGVCRLPSVPLSHPSIDEEPHRRVSHSNLSTER